MFNLVFPILKTRDVAVLRAFYLAIGFGENFRWPADGDVEYCTVAVPGAGEIGIGLGEGGPAPDAFELCLRTDDVDSTVASVTAHGATVEQAAANMPWGERMAYVLDPAGHRLHIYGPTV